MRRDSTSNGDVWQQHHQAVFQIVQRLDISWRVDRTAKVKTCNIIIIEDVEFYHEIMFGYILSTKTSHNTQTNREEKNEWNEKDFTKIL